MYLLKGGGKAIHRQIDTNLELNPAFLIMLSLPLHGPNIRPRNMNIENSSFHLLK
jgi:hypothetical protein